MADAAARRAVFRECRHKLGLTQRQVCKDLEITDPHYRNIESGRGNPDAKLLFKLSNYFGVTPQELFPDLAEIRVDRPSSTPMSKTS